jgi:two-component system NarL family response regulator
MPLIKILIISGSNSNKPGLTDMIGQNKDFKVISKVAFTKETIANLGAFKPHVIIFDFNLVDKKGIELIEEIKQKLPDAHVLALTMDTDQHHFYRIIKAGALGYILKDADPDTFYEAIRRVARGDAYIQPYLLTKLVTEFRQLANEKQPVSSEHGLTQRELEIVGFIARGKSNKDIAAKLYISEKTVKNHVSSILKKMGLQDRTQVAIYTHQKGLLSPKSRRNDT